MSIITTFFAIFVVAQSPINEPTREQLIQLIDAAQEANCRDVSFDYEGRRVVSKKSEPELVVQNYTGRFTRRADGAMLVDIYNFEKQFSTASQSLVSILHGQTELLTRKNDQKKASISIKKQSPLEYAGTSNYRKICLSDMVLNFAKSEYKYEFEGIKKLDGHECLVVRFRLVLDDKTPNDLTISYVYWIDLKRGGQVLRFEQRYRGENLASLTSVRLDRFEPGPGRVAWLPVSGREEIFISSEDNKQVYLNSPIVYEVYDMIPITVKFDRGLKDDSFSVNAKSGDAVSDEVRKAQYEFGQYMVRDMSKRKIPTDVEIKANLDRMLMDSEVMNGELKAGSPLRDGPGILSYWPWSVAMLAFVVVGVLYRRSR